MKPMEEPMNWMLETESVESFEPTDLKPRMALNSIKKNKLEIKEVVIHIEQLTLPDRSETNKV